MMSESREILTFDAFVPAVVFADGGVDKILEQIRQRARAVPIDISTPKGREECASLAYKIARSKTALDAMGKELGENHYRSWKAITSERAHITKELDALRDEVRQPLTEWEDDDKARISSHEAALDAIKAVGALGPDAGTEALEARITQLRQPSERDWQEFKTRAEDARAASLGRLLEAHRIAVERETAAAEAERLRAEKAEQERRARDALFAELAKREAEERAKREAEAQARRVEEDKRRAVEQAAKAALEEQERKAAAVEKLAREARAELERKAAASQARLEAEKAAAEERARKAEAERLAAEERQRAAEERAEREKAAAVEAERQRVAAEQERERQAAQKREADRKHWAKINGEAKDALVAAGLSESAATAAVTAIARGLVPHVRISY